MTVDGEIMPTDEIISYDLDELAEMTIKQLAVQVIARLDLNRPKREGHVEAKKFYEDAYLECQDVLEDVEKLGIPYLENQLKDVIAKYFEAVVK